jgi:ligand-binding sensor domain-containing protein
VGQSPSPKKSFTSFAFQNISTKQGLSTRAVTDIAQDANGMIWVATVDGVNRLDGYRIKQFFNAANDKSALFNSDRGSLNTEFADKVWIAGQTGISSFNLKTSQFDRVDTAHKTRLHIQKRVRFFKQNDTLWAFGHEFYYKISLDGKVEEYKYNNTSGQISTKHHAFSNFITLANEDTHGNLWAINPFYLMRIDAGTMLIMDFYKIRDDNGDGAIQDIDIKNDIIYISTWGSNCLQY